MQRQRYDFASDNTAGICPQAWQALQEANSASDASYGNDRWTERLRGIVREIFETDCEVFLVFNGTAANALALSQMCRPFHGVVCHQRAHIETDECGAPEFFSGGAKLSVAGGTNGKLSLEAVKDTLGRFLDVHSTKPRVLSLTQSTEHGTVYTRDELAALAEFARSRSLFLHMDGARFANALATLGCSPKEITWQLGFDVLCFGGTKNGIGAGEVIVFFRRELAEEFDYRVKQAGQLASKTRFLAAPWVGLLSDSVWLRNAAHANAAAASLAEKLHRVAGIELAFPREANALFARIPEQLVERLHARGWHFANFFEPGVFRLMGSWATTDEVIEEFVADVAAAGR